MFNYQPMAQLPLRVPSPMTLRKAIKCPKRASKLIKRHLGNGTLKSVSRCEGRIVVTFYITGRSCDWHNWSFDYKENVRVRKQAAKTFIISKCLALVPLDLTPKVVTMLATDFAY